MYLSCYKCTFDKNNTCYSTNTIKSCNALNEKACYLKVNDKNQYKLDCYANKTQCEKDAKTIICQNDANCSVTCCDEDYCNNPIGQPTPTVSPTITLSITPAIGPTSGKPKTAAPTSGCDFVGEETFLHLALSMIASSLVKAAL